MTVTQAAEALGISRTAVLQAIDRGSIPAERFGPIYMLRCADVEVYREQRPWSRKPGWPQGKKRTNQA